MALPHPVIGDFGYALMLAQRGKKHQNAKPLKGFGSKQGIATPKRDLDLIKFRLKLAETIAKEIKS